MNSAVLIGTHSVSAADTPMAEMSSQQVSAARRARPARGLPSAPVPAHYRPRSLRLDQTTPVDPYGWPSAGTAVRLAAATDNVDGVDLLTAQALRIDRGRVRLARLSRMLRANTAGESGAAAPASTHNAAIRLGMSPAGSRLGWFASKSGTAC